MNSNAYRIATWLTLWIVFTFLSVPPKAFGGGKVGIYGVRMVPYGVDAESYSRAGWGGGLHAVVPVEELSNVFAGTAGLEVINLLSEKESFQDARTGLRVDQETDQSYFRLYLGTQIGGHGNGFFRPHAGINIALVYYYIKTDVIVP